MTTRARLCLSMLLLALGAARVAAAADGGSLVIIGGALRYRHAEIWNRIVELAGGAGSKIAVLPTASSEPLLSGARAVDALRRSGGDAFIIPLHAEHGGAGLELQAGDPALVAQIKSASGVYFTGGSQDRITAALCTADGERSAVLKAIWEVYDRGGVIAGTSAGAAIMSQMMFRNSSSVLTTLREGLEKGKELVPGLGFLNPAWFVEQHCLVRGRFGRTLAALRTLQLKYGVGIDEDTALIVERGRAMSALGYKGAIVLDLSQATSDAGAKAFNIKKARLSYLDQGDSMDLETLDLTPSAQKQAMAAPETPSASGGGERFVVADILGNFTVVDVMARVAGGRDSEAIGLAFDPAQARLGASVGFEFRFYRERDTRGWYSSSSGAGSYTVSNVYLDVRPVEFNGPLYK